MQRQLSHSDVSPLASPVRDLLGHTPFQPFAPVLDKWFTEDLERIYGLVRSGDHGLFPGILEELGIRHQCAPEDLGRIPAAGPAIVIANHPFGLADPLILGALLAGVRKDFRFLANSFLKAIPQLDQHIIPVNPFGGSNAVRENRKSMRQSVEWLNGGGLLVVFPAGEVASMRLPDLGIKDPEWTESVARLMVRTGASAIPVFFHGTNSPVFHFAGLLHPSLRTFLLPHELLNKAGSEIRVSIGRPIPADRLAHLPGFHDATEYLRARTYLLEGRVRPLPRPKHFLQPNLNRKPADLAGAQSSSAMEREIESLPPGCHLLSAGEHLVCVATADHIPTTLLEIGRLRELTFRRAGEGSGEATDLDAFDRHYEHLLVWNQEKREVVGAYRLARTDEVLERRGARGLYTGTLFRLHPNFYEAISPALELGRSFVRPEYQRGYLPLLLLWKGLAHYVAANPRYRILFGPVSISKDYTPSSRALMAGYLSSHRSQHLAAYIKPRKQFRVRALSGCDPRNFGSLLSNVEDLSELVADLETDHKGIPILLRQYLNLGGQVLEFSVDRKFSSVLDGLIVVDLVKASPAKLERYMGKDNARSFLAYHAALA